MNIICLPITTNIEKFHARIIKISVNFGIYKLSNLKNAIPYTLIGDFNNIQGRSIITHRLVG